MRSRKTIHVVSCHAEGEVGDVIVGGVAPPPGKTLWDQRTWIANDQTLRNWKESVINKIIHAYPHSYRDRLAYNDWKGALKYLDRLAKEKKT